MSIPRSGRGLRGLKGLGCLFLAFLFEAHADADAGTSRGPAVVVFGGGWGAEGTQASMEAHVLALARALPDRAVTTLFASGDPRVRDVQIPGGEVNEVSRLLGMVFDRLEHVDVAYRASSIASNGPASKRKLLEILDRSRDQPGGTVVFGIGHGSPPTDNDVASIELFGPSDRLYVDELAKQLDGSPRKGPTAFVLGQCHSGAFTDLLYVAGDPSRRLASPTRCVLAAVPSDRQASGCTIDVADPDARAYVAMMADALARPRDSDLDGNGRVSLAEAHAYARIHDRTVDVPVKTSDVYLAKAVGDRAASTATLTLEHILERARPEERKVINELRPHAHRDALKKAVHDLDELESKQRELSEDIEELRDDWDRIRRGLLDQLLLKYPELANPYHPDSRRLLAGDAREVVSFLKPRRELLELDARESEIEAKENERLELERRAARFERWLGAIQRVANEELIQKVGTRRQLMAFERLVACEAMEP